MKKSNLHRGDNAVKVKFHIRKLLFVLTALAAVLATVLPFGASTAAAVGEGEAVVVGNDTVTFRAVSYNYPAESESTWYYTVESGSAPAISHVTYDIWLASCLAGGLLEAGTWDGTNLSSLNTNDGMPVEGPDKTTDQDTVLKFDQGFDSGETRHYYFTLNANYAEGAITFASKASTGYETALVTGPKSDCSVIDGAQPPSAPVAVDDAASTNEDTPVVINVAANDSDADGDLAAGSAVVVLGPENGTLAKNDDGSFTYTPNANFFGTDSFTYKIYDEGGLESNTVMVTITVNPVNDAPVAKDDTLAAVEDSPLYISPADLLANDTDVENDNLLYVSAATQPANGTLSQGQDENGKPVVVYTPNANFCGTDSFMYQISDGQGGSATAKVTITVECVNDAPVAADDSLSVNEDAVLTVTPAQLLGNDTDADAVYGDVISIGEGSVIYPANSNGTLVANEDGSYTYTPNPNWCGTETFTYTATDGEADSNAATVTITVNCINDAPVANDDSYATTQDVPLTIAAPGLLGNDVDVDLPYGDVLSASAPAASQFGGTVTVNADGSFGYVPAPGFAGIDSFTYTVTDSAGATATATVTITVTATNNRSINVGFNSWTRNADNTLSGALTIKNASGPYSVQVNALAIEAEYRARGGVWTAVGVGNCSFSPSPLFLVGAEQAQDVTFSGCTLLENVPNGSSLRLTATVQINGRINGSKTDGWYLSRLAKAY
jgi:VCBS repeat-containing protein